MGRGHRHCIKTLAGAGLAGPEHRVHIGHRVAQIGHRRGGLPEAPPGQLGGQTQQTGGVWLVGGIAHGDQGGLAEGQPLLQHVAGGGGLRTAHKPPGKIGRREGREQSRLHQQGFGTDKTAPVAGISLGIAAEIEAAKHLHQRLKARQRLNTMAAQQLQAGLPVVVPGALRFQSINAGWIWPPTAVVMHRFSQGAAVAAAYIPDHAIDVKQQHGARLACGAQGSAAKRLVG